MTNYPQLAGQVVVGTGVASGIGLAQARAFLAQGVTFFGTDLVENTELIALKQAYPTNFYFYPCDVRKSSDIKQLAAFILAHTTQVDILLNTAGILDAYTPSLETTEALWDNIFDTNLKSIFLLTNALLPTMLAQKHGVIVNMASIAGLIAGGGGAAYTASKHAIIGYTKQLAFDYAAKGIRVNCIAPGAIKTPMNQADFLGDAMMAKEVAQNTPAKRWADPSEVAELSLFLASPVADYIHGSVMQIDGGWSVGK